MSRDGNVRFSLGRHHSLQHFHFEMFLKKVGVHIYCWVEAKYHLKDRRHGIEFVLIHYNDSYLLCLNILSILASSLVSPSRIEYPNLPPDN